VALGVSDGIAHNGWRRHRYGVLFQEEKMVINGTQITYQPQSVKIRQETGKD